jgi:hypothetical protein
MDRRAARRAVAISLARAIAGVVVVVSVYYALPLAAESGPAIALRITIAAVLTPLLVIWELKAVERADHPELRAIEALSVTVAFMVVVFAVGYSSMSMRDERAFNEVLDRTSALYFTMTTLTTIGYGDIFARTDAARVAVMLQMLFNVAVIGAAVRLIAGTARHHADSIARGGDR